MSPLPPCVLHEDEHLLVVNKPPGWNTHSPSPYAGEGIYEWLKHREPRWARLAIIHRLDKETSGVLVFGKTPLANKSLTEQFTERSVRKEYLLLTDRPLPVLPLHISSTITRRGNRYFAGPQQGGGDLAETHFRPVEDSPDLPSDNLTLCIEAAPDGGALPAEVPRNICLAQPLTGRTHQIRVHAAEHGFPILGDTLYGGTPFARLCLHAERLTFTHPEDGRKRTYGAPAEFASAVAALIRSALANPGNTNALRLIHGAADGWPGCYVERCGDALLSQAETRADSRLVELFSGLMHGHACTGVFHKVRRKDVRQTEKAEAAPELICADGLAKAPCAIGDGGKLFVRENGLTFELGFSEGCSVGLFLDQRDNRRRLLVNHVGADFGPVFIVEQASSLSHTSPSETAGMRAQKSQRDRLEACPAVLNTFAYTCSFSVAAAKAGACVTSLDLSRKYLDWGRRNFELNGLDPAQHDFIYGDCFDWMKRLAKKGRVFDAVLLDPPTFSQSKQSGVWRAEKDYGKLVTLALPLLKPKGVLFASTNAATLKPERFLEMVELPIAEARRKIARQHYAPQPPDFPITREEPAHLKTLWLSID
jgi:23S rRNA (cytosine1962-C5)-methyltransferase